MPSIVKDKIRAHLKDALRRQELSDEIDIFENGLVDSMFAVQLVAFTEEAFDITVEDEDLDLENFRSIDGLTHFVTRKLEGH